MTMEVPDEMNDDGDEGTRRRETKIRLGGRGRKGGNIWEEKKEREWKEGVEREGDGKRKEGK